MRKPITVGMLVALGVIAGVTLALSPPSTNHAPKTLPAIEWLDMPRSLDQFELHSADTRFDNSSLLGQWSVVWFGFLNCPDICPTNASELKKLKRALGDTPEANDIAFVFVSVDPGRDSPEEASAYAKAFHPTFQGVTGSALQLNHLADSLAIQFGVHTDNDRYDVTHSLMHSIIGPSGKLVGRFPPGQNVESIADALQNKIQVESLTAAPQISGA